FARQILEHFDLMRYFDFVAGATMNGSRSKKDDVIRYAVSSYPINNLSESIMIGDREHDILGANKVGMDSIGVLFGYGDYDELKKAGATYIVKDMKAILNIAV
ncbi:MAG: HAD hydrolase-like protein, partial [Huintestinicola sp.]